MTLTTAYSSNSTGSSVTNCRISPIIASDTAELHFLQVQRPLLMPCSNNNNNKNNNIAYFNSYAVLPDRSDRTPREKMHAMWLMWRSPEGLRNTDSDIWQTEEAARSSPSSSIIATFPHLHATCCWVTSTKWFSGSCTSEVAKRLENLHILCDSGAHGNVRGTERDTIRIKTCVMMSFGSVYACRAQSVNIISGFSNPHTWWGWGGGVFWYVTTLRTYDSYFFYLVQY